MSINILAMISTTQENK
ncbi:TPA: hypothetical protein ACUA8O_000770 [Escherichia coli]|nr:MULTISPECIES: hypothetical protein [Escherichia]MBV7578077.1 hypothetical protein [Escherichia fergusonii]MBY7194491.1 hypothetical protein [Escherichia fergusonii]MBY7230536.1 hypothetical protein [Escherichia fergusonii]MBY7288984.1 hypothetical protein [Escherichia fergusonii]MBY7446149.1 hypothetical protein [Escherichia fergusonii]